MELPDTMSDEEKRMRRLKVIVDLTAAVLAQEKMSIDEALDLMNATKQTVLRLFPGKENTYNMIYGRRFERILKARFEVLRDEHNPAGKREQSASEKN
jgi:hypothetical protein